MVVSTSSKFEFLSPLYVLGNSFLMTDTISPHLAFRVVKSNASSAVTSSSSSAIACLSLATITFGF